MRFGDLNREAGDEVEDVEVEASLIMGTVGIDSDRGLITVIPDARNHDGGPKHVSGDTSEGCLVVRRDCSSDVYVEAGMRPGADELHAFPAQKISPVLRGQLNSTMPASVADYA